jgi:RNA polymerase-associated protein CTR9
LCSLLEIEHAAPRYWMMVALAYAKQSKIDYAIETLIVVELQYKTTIPREI